jgi:hypothetical protein
MEPTEPTMPDASQAPPPPPVGWAPPVEPPPPMPGAGAGALFNNRPAGSLTLGDAITTGFTTVGKPSFIIPVLIIGAIIQALVSLVIAPFRNSLSDLSAGATPTLSDVSGAINGILVSVLVGIIGGIVVAVYGQVWAVAASSGPLPTINETLGLVSRRWVSVLATAILVGLISIATFILTFLVAGVVAAIAGALGILAFLAGLVFYAWIASRLSMSVWLAAEGNNVGASLNGSWAMTQGNLLRIIGWSIAYGLIFAIVGAVLGAVLSLVPVIGPAIASAITLALGYGGGVTLFRRTQAAAGMGAPVEAAPQPAM